jgi:hypothetical protein
VLLAGERLQPSSKGTRIKFSARKRTVIDGPFPELGELIAGFWMFLVNSKEEAIEWVKRCRILFVAASTRSKSAGSLRHRI